MNSSEKLFYRLNFPNRAQHLVSVELQVATQGSSELTLWMPVWTPGSYLVREYSRHVEGFEVRNEAGQPLPWKKSAKNRWTLTTDGASSVVVRYRLYGREKSVRTNWIDSDYALISSASTFMTVEGREKSPHAVQVDLPESWKTVTCALPFSDGVFEAPNLDALIDSPFVMGNPEIIEFDVDDKPVVLLNQGGGSLWSGAGAAADVQQIVEAYRDMFAGVPFSRYVFFNLIVEGGGGLEHKNSTVLMTSRYTYRDRKKYVSWLGLVSHEFFHVWNVKRSRPIALGPFDYENEVYTRSLWVAEGVTAYYTDLIPCRAQLTTESEYLSLLSEKLHKLANTPGRTMQSLEESSFDAWIKLYRADENTVNTTVSYYLKGGVVAWLLDLQLREATGGTKSLDDLMRLLYAEYSGAKGFTDAQVQEAAETVAGGSLDNFFAKAVRSREELEFDRALSYLGLRFRKPNGNAAPWLGIDAKSVGGRLVITSVRRDGPGYEAGLNVQDELLAVGGYRVTGENHRERLLQYALGERIELLISRFDAVRSVPIVLGSHPGNPWQLERDPSAPASALANFQSWIYQRP